MLLDSTRQSVQTADPKSLDEDEGGGRVPTFTTTYPRSLTLGTIGLLLWLTLSCTAKTDAGDTLPLEQRNSHPRYGHGRLATETEIAAWDRDVMPDGEGLPEGSGDVQTGRDLYAAACARCHGAQGQGGPFDVLVGRLPNDDFPFAEDPRVRKTIGNYWPWATTVFDYTRRAMPLDRPGSLSDDEVYSLTAYLLYLNGLVEEGRHSRPSLASKDRNARARSLCRR